MDKSIAKTTTSIGIDISKKKCDYCVLDSKGNVVERGQYSNTIQDARQAAQEMARKYGPKKGGCAAVCESTANMWITTFEAFEDVGIDISLANPWGCNGGWLCVRSCSCLPGPIRSHYHHPVASQVHRLRVPQACVDTQVAARTL